MDCDFLVSMNTGLLKKVPCSLKQARILQFVLIYLDKFIHRQRPTPIGFSKMSVVAAAPLKLRLENAIKPLKQQRKGPVHVAIVPWKGRWHIEEQEPYFPAPIESDRIPELFRGDFSIVQAFTKTPDQARLYLPWDSHLSPDGTKLVVSQIIAGLEFRENTISLETED